jgi:hypothetical protein
MSQIINPTNVEVLTTSGTSQPFTAVGSSRGDVYRFCCGAASYIVAAGTPVATVAHTYVPADQEVFVFLDSGMKLAVIQDSAADVASLTLAY